MSEEGSRSPSRDQSPEKSEKNKLFITNLDSSIPDSDLQDELKKILEEFGKISAISVKKSKTGDYSYAFVEYETGVDGQKAINNLNGQQFKGKPLKIELQSFEKKRKDPEKGCYNCGKKGHFARECHSKPTSDSRGGYRGRDRSRSRHRSRSRNDEKHKKRRRSVSDSRDRDRSKNKKKKERKERSRDKSKDRSRDRDEKKKKKHKKHRRSSDRSRS